MAKQSNSRGVDGNIKTSIALILIVGHADSNLERSDMALVGQFWFAGGLLEGYGGQFKAAEHGGKAVDIDSTSYMCVMCAQCRGTIHWPLGCVWLCWECFCLSVCL